MTLPSCAFCIAQPLLPLSSRHAAQPATGFRCPSIPVTRRLPLRPSAKRPRVNTPCAQFKQNGGPNDRFRNQTADFLLQAGRFFQSSTGQVVLWGTLVWLVLTGRIGVLFDSFLILFAFVTIVPVLAILVFRWWVARQVVQSTCPLCGSSVTGLKGKSFPCNVCGNTVTPEDSGNFSVKDPSSATIDIDAKEVDDW